jgi:hypothetical protein
MTRYSRLPISSPRRKVRRDGRQPLKRVVRCTRERHEPGTSIMPAGLAMTDRLDNAAGNRRMDPRYPRYAAFLDISLLNNSPAMTRPSSERIRHVVYQILEWLLNFHVENA